MKSETTYYNEAIDYLLTFDGITKDVLDEYTNKEKWKSRKPNDMKELFKRFLHHAKNKQGMPNSIGNVGKLSEILFNFNHNKIIAEYRTWEDVFDAIQDSNYRPPGRMEKYNNRSYWVQYCKSIMSIANFISNYKNLDEWNEFVNGFLTNEQSKLALPLLLKEEIDGFGFALACDFIKESVSPQFVKPDVHINWIALKLGITQSTKDYQIFKDVELYCNEINELPYAVDKIFWLVGSGNFHLHDIKIKCSREEFTNMALPTN